MQYWHLVISSLLCSQMSYLTLAIDRLTANKNCTLELMVEGTSWDSQQLRLTTGEWMSTCKEMDHLWIAGPKLGNPFLKTSLCKHFLFSFRFHFLKRKFSQMTLTKKRQSAESVYLRKVKWCMEHLCYPAHSSDCL